MRSVIICFAATIFERPLVPKLLFIEPEESSTNQTLWRIPALKMSKES